ncbi:MAG TPA: NUDIX hydrolase [Rhizomicrobium sp.]|nr:NUDIX hydrolase [Rhizomicrobium sp.]
MAALPYRVTPEGAVEILLITSRRTHRWIVPKGWTMEGLSAASAAAREAFEEAGVSGEIASEPLGVFHYLKEKHGTAIPCRVSLFPLKVARQHRAWPERDARDVKWLPAEEAAALVGEPELRRLILKFGVSKR